MPNILAYVMLLGWPAVAAILFRRLPLEKAFIWTIMGGYLALPPVAYLDLPLIPPLDKHSIPALSAFVLLWVHQGRMPRLVPRSSIAKVFLCILLFSGIGTVLTNSDAQVIGVVYLPPLPTTEVFVGVIYQLVQVLPMLLAQDILKRPEHIRQIVLAMMIAGLLYSFPMLLEVRLSPQINIWIYGFFQHSFEQMVRYGGFRPIVFLQHGLWVALFAFTAAGCALLMLKQEQARRAQYFAATIYLAVVLVLCKSAGSLIYMICFAPLVMLTSQRMQIRIAAVLALVVVLYPLLRGTSLIPIEAIYSQASAMDADRAQSLGFRLMNEDILLERASERPVFGWGGWERNLLHDPVSGRVTSVIDGLWVGAIGTKGWAGYLGLFGVLTLPLFLLVQRAGSLNLASAPYVAPLALLLAFNLVDLIPNATLVPYTWLIAGALLGYACSRDTAPAQAVVVEKAPREPAPWARKPAPVA
jgi:hypothetical protein